MHQVKKLKTRGFPLALHLTWIVLTSLVIGAFGAGILLDTQEGSEQLNSQHIQQQEFSTQLVSDQLKNQISRVSRSSFNPQWVGRMLSAKQIVNWSLWSVSKNATEPLTLLQKKTSERPIPFASRMLRTVGEKWNPTQGIQNKIWVETIEPDPHSSRQWMVIYRYKMGIRPGSKDNVQEPLVSVTVVDPMTIFKSIVKEPSEGVDIYLANSQGLILAHTKTSYVGSQLANTPLYQQGISAALQGKEIKKIRGRFDSVGSRQVYATVTTLPGLPYVVVAESAPSRQMGWIGRWKKIEKAQLGFLLLASLLPIWGMGYLVVRRLFRYRIPASDPFEKLAPINQQLDRPAEEPEGDQLVSHHDEATQTQHTPRTIPATDQAAGRQRPIEAGNPEQWPNEWPDEPTQKTQTPPQDQVATFIKQQPEKTAINTVPSFSNVSDLNEARQLVREFEMSANQIHDSNVTLAMLTDAVARLCESPVLYFSYQPNRDRAILDNDSGFEDGHAPVEMAFNLNRRAQKRILSFAKQNKLASLSKYEPLRKLLISRFGVAYFEAWAVTSFPDNNQNIQKSKEPIFLGVIVILQPSVNSSENRDLLVRMMNKTAQQYEKESQERGPII